MLRVILKKSQRSYNPIVSFGSISLIFLNFELILFLCASGYEVNGGIELYCAANIKSRAIGAADADPLPP